MIGHTGAGRIHKLAHNLREFTFHSMTNLEIIYQDDALVAVNKPSGLLVHRSMIDRHETEFALQKVRDQIGQRVYPVHRLDKPTSGVLVFALSPETARKLSSQFAENRVFKRYIAVVRGYTPDYGVIDHPLKEELDKIADKRAQKDKPPQDAITEYKTLATVEIPEFVERYPQTRYSLVECLPKTGRKHQIRRHMKHIAHPIIGDAKHGKGVHNRFFQSRYDSHRLLLTCVEMKCKHPISGVELILTASLDEQFLRVINSLGLSNSIRFLHQG
ncbi:tRNA pseudouridine(65) synthase TruC [Aurantivibrio plasticivorans]